MSSTSTLCQGLQSCLEPLVIEPRVLVHQLAPPKHASSNPENPKNHPIENNKNGQEQKPTWNLLQSLTKSYKKLNDDHQDGVYIHPLVKRSTSTLSSRSLEMCTESLGSETGDGIDSYNGDFSYNNIIEKQGSISSPIKIPKAREIRKKVKHSSSFPPPLTSISGNDGVQVKTHREGGRLVIKAYNYSSCNTCFQTERENGRLRLSLPIESFKGDEEEVEEENVDEYEMFFSENDDKEQDEFNGYFWGENGGRVKSKRGGKEWSSNTRCNGDRSKRIPSLPFCVAIS